MVMHQQASTGEFVEDSGVAKVLVKDKHPTFHLKIYSPFVIYFDAPAESLSAKNITGPFDILPHHHNFITLLEAGDLEIKGANVGGLGHNSQKIRISGGVMHVKADKIDVFLDV